MKWWIGAIGLLIAGMVFRLGLLVYAMYALLGVMILSRFLARAWIDNLTAERESSEEKREIGDTTDIVIHLENKGALPVAWMLIEDSVPREALEEEPPRIKLTGSLLRVTQLGIHGEKTLRYQAQFLTRGYFQFGPMLAETGDLFGLHRRYKVLTKPHFVLVLPKVIPLVNYNLASRRPMGDVRITHRLFEDPTRINGVRQYQRGDPLNRVHWHATARTGVLHSKTYEPSCIAGVTVVLDFHRESYPARARAYRTELAVTTAASLCHTVHLLRQQVGFVSNGRDAADRISQEGWRHEFQTRAAAQSNVQMLASSDRLRPVVVETRRGEGQMTEILESLARLELTDGLTLSQTISETASRLPRNATIVAVLGAVTDDTAAALGALRRRGFAVTAVIILFDEPQHPDWARQPEWAGRLMSEGMSVRFVRNESELSTLCSEQLVGAN